MLDDTKTVFTVASWIFLAVPCSWLLWKLYEELRERPTLRSVAILVLGDIGRSPRMMYHAESFAKSGFETYMVGYPGRCFQTVISTFNMIRVVWMVTL